MRRSSPPRELRLRGRDVAAFHVWGGAGLAAAVLVALGVCLAAGLSLWVEAALILAACATFLTLALVTKLLLGREALIYYHHEIAVVLVAALLAAALGAPVAGHLDATVLGLGAFLAFGRIGCLCAGCCHGRAVRRGRGRGVVYGHAHGAELPPRLVGVPLVPVQALEALAVALLVGVALVLVLPSGNPGAAAALYLSGYAAIRFTLELLRGDLRRPYVLGLSAAQWTSLGVAATVALLCAAGALPDAPLHLAVLAALALAAPLLARRRAVALLDPRHVAELTRLLPAPRAGYPAVRETSLGVRCSSGLDAGLAHYTLSRPQHALARDDAGELARTILARRHPDATGDLIAGSADTYHVLIRLASRHRRQGIAARRRRAAPTRRTARGVPRAPQSWSPATAARRTRTSWTRWLSTRST